MKTDTSTIDGITDAEESAVTKNILEPEVYPPVIKGEEVPEGDPFHDNETDQTDDEETDEDSQKEPLEE